VSGKFDIYLKMLHGERSHNLDSSPFVIRVEKIRYGCGMDLTGSGNCPVADFCADE
jgi:hypothetical protein